MSEQQRKIYQNDADRYEALISREDHQGNIMKALEEIVNPDLLAIAVALITDVVLRS